MAPEVSHKRAPRVAHLLQQELASLFVAGLKDPRVGFVTVTEVRLSDDLRQATVYVSVLGAPAQRQASLQGLRGAAGYLRHALGERLKLRFAPHLHFTLDTTLDEALRLEQLLQAAAAGAPETPPRTAPELLPEAHTTRQMTPWVAPPPVARPAARAHKVAAKTRRRIHKPRGF